MIYIENKKRKLENIQKQYPNADILDITSTTEKKYAQLLSPFYPHGGIPVPFTPGMTAACVEGIWQGLKVFEYEDISIETLQNRTMKNLKRTVRKYGVPKGHRKGVYGKELLDYFTARMLIYLPSYKWVLENIPEVQKVVNKIKARAKDHDIVLLDYNTNIDFRDVSSPISHAGLLKAYIDGTYPIEGVTYQPLTEAEIAAKKSAKKKSNGKSRKQLELF